MNESKYQLLIKNSVNAGIKHLNDPKAFIEYSKPMDDVNHNIDNYNPNLCFMTWLLIWTLRKNFKLLSKNYLLDAENRIYHVYLSHNLIFLFQKTSDEILPII